MSVNATEARRSLYRLIRDVNDSHEPVVIAGKHGDAVLIGADDWRAIQETLYLNAMPGVAESIAEGLAQPLTDLSPEPGW